MASPKNGTHSEATVMTDGESTVIDRGSVLTDILFEMRESRNLLSKMKENTEDEMRKSRNLLSEINRKTNNKITEMVRLKERNDLPVKVFIRTSFVHVGDIGAIKQEFKCEFYLSVKWKEPEHKGKKENDFIEWENYWDPNVYILDAVSYDIHEKEQKLIIPKDPSDKVPYVIQYFHIKGTFKEVLEVKDFPFDYQDLQIRLTSRRESNEIKLCKDPHRDDNIRTWNFIGEQEWELQKHVLTESSQIKPEEGSSESKYRLYTVQLHVRRKYGFYIYSIALLMFLITALTFTTFVISVGSRMNITLTLLLASVAFKYYVNHFVPTVSYLTFLEKYILSCFIFQFGMAAVHNTTSGLITSTKSLEIFEWVCFAVGLLVFVGMNTVFAAMSVAKVKGVNRKMKEHKLKYIKKNKGVKARCEDKKIPNVIYMPLMGTD